MNSAITNTRDLREALRHPYVWPGGYPIYLVLSDGEMLCHACAKTEYRQISQALRDHDHHSGWRPVSAEVLWESPDEPELCAHCNKTLKPAYGDDQ